MRQNLFWLFAELRQSVVDRAQRLAQREGHPVSGAAQADLEEERLIRPWGERLQAAQRLQRRIGQLTDRRILAETIAGRIVDRYQRMRDRCQGLVGDRGAAGIDPRSDEAIELV